MLQAYIKTSKMYLLALLLIPVLAVAAPEKNLFVEGQDYIRMPDSTRKNPYVEQLLMSDPHKVQVLFFFSYGCHGCEMFHAPFEQWAAKQRANPKNKLAMYVYPVSFNVLWAALAKVYYIATALEPSGKLNTAIFTAVQKKGLKLWEPEVLKKFLMQNGYTGVQIEQASNSFMVNRQVKRADDLSKAYSVTATPDVIINGPVHSYKIDMAKAGNNIPRMIDILNYLVARETKLM